MLLMLKVATFSGSLSVQAFLVFPKEPNEFVVRDRIITRRVVALPLPWNEDTECGPAPLRTYAICSIVPALGPPDETPEDEPERCRDQSSLL